MQIVEVDHVVLDVLTRADDVADEVGFPELQCPAHPFDERKERRQPHIMSWDEQNRILQFAPDNLRVLVVLLTETGLRVNREALTLRWEDIDFQDTTLYVRDSKTPDGRRVVPLSELCKETLARWQQHTSSFHSEWVFPNYQQPSLHLQTLRPSWKSTLKCARIPYFAVYNCRHTAASRMAGAGIPDVIIRQLIGHTANSNVLLTYAKAVDEVPRAAIRELEQHRESAATWHSNRSIQ
jgi:integrase